MILNSIFFTRWIDYVFKSKIRACMRAYGELRRTKKVQVVRDLLENVIDVHLFDGNDQVSKHIYGASFTSAEKLTRQYLFQMKSANYKLARSAICSFGGGYMQMLPLPKRWLDVVEVSGMRVKRISSKVVWLQSIFIYWAYGVWMILKIVAVSLHKTFTNQCIVRSPYSYFWQLSKNNLPEADENGVSYDICSWYAKWGERPEGVLNIRHGVHGVEKICIEEINVEYIDLPYYQISEFSKIFQFMWWALVAMLISAIDALRGRYWHALMLGESAKAKSVQLCDASEIARDYLFHYSGSVYRPMWTYEVEKKGARILCYFYSVSEQVTPPSGNVSQRYEWGAASWPCYMVWDSYQADVIRREIDQNVTIKIVGPIWFSSSRIALPRLPAKSAAVFDLQQHRPSTYLPINTYAEYRYTHPDLNQRFLYEVYEALSEVGYTMVFKRKRDIGNKIVKNYKRCLDELSYKDDVIVVNPDVAAVKVIQGCRIAISMPFTSTALYNCPGVTSIYYDPTGWVQKNDRAAHGILVISGKNELRNWLKSINDDL